MKFSKHWKTRKIAISPSHIDFLKELAEQTGFNSLSDVVNHALGEYRSLKNNNTNTKTNTNTNTNTTASNIPDTADTSSDDNDDFGLGNLI